METVFTSAALSLQKELTKPYRLSRHLSSAGISVSWTTVYSAEDPQGKSNIARQRLKTAKVLLALSDADLQTLGIERLSLTWRRW